MPPGRTLGGREKQQRPLPDDALRIVMRAAEKEHKLVA